VLQATRLTLQLNPQACSTDVACFEARLQEAARLSDPQARAARLAAAATR
jgi:hypothetical protein